MWCIFRLMNWSCWNKAYLSIYLSRPKWAPNKVASWLKSSTCVNLRLRLARALRQQEEWTSYGASVPAMILLVPNEFINRRSCQYLRIVAIIVLAGQSSQTDDPLHWDPTPQNHFPKCSSQNCDLRFLTIDNIIQKRACCFVFDYLNGTPCFPFKDYFQWLHHNALNTRNNNNNKFL